MGRCGTGPSSFVQSRAASLTEALKKRLEDVGGDAIKAEQERFRLRLKEVERAMSENTIAKLEKERDRLIADMRQLTLIDIDRRVQEDRLRDLEAELQRRSSHFNELLARLKAEQDRILSLVLPKRYQLRQSAQVFPGGCRDPPAGERSMINHIDPLNQFTWWSSLKHGGLLIAPARLAHYFSTRETPVILLLGGAPPQCRPGATGRREVGRASRHCSTPSWKASCNFRRWSGRRRAPSARNGDIASSRARTSNLADSGWEAMGLCCRSLTTM